MLRLAEFLTPQEAELLRMALGDAGIPAVVESAGFVTWFWHYAAAVRGVRLYVRALDAEAARRVLADLEEPRPTERRACGGCGTSLPVSWHVCWKCGTTAAGAADEAFWVDDDPPRDALASLREIQCLGVVCLLVCALAVLSPAVLLLLIFAAILPRGDDGRQADDPALATWTPEEDADQEPSANPTEAGDERCQRALASALFATSFLPPLALYSLAVLLTLDRKETPVGARGWRHWWLALAINALWPTLLVSIFLLSPADSALPPRLWDIAYAAVDWLRSVLTGVP